MNQEVTTLRISHIEEDLRKHREDHIYVSEALDKLRPVPDILIRLEADFDRLVDSMESERRLREQVSLTRRGLALTYNSVIMGAISLVVSIVFNVWHNVH